MITTNAQHAPVPRTNRFDNNSDSNDPFRLAIATVAHDAQVDQLRIGAYTKAGYFSIPNPELLRRKADPENAICLIIANKKEIAATFRVGLARDRTNAEALLQGPCPLAGELFPTLTLCRGATNPAFRRQGLMTFLVGIGVAIANQAGLQSATGMQAEGTPHFGAMLASGWQNKEVASEDTQCVRMATAEMQLVYISRTRFGYSANYGEEQYHHLHKSFRSAEAVVQGALMIEKIRAGRLGGSA